MQGGGGRRIELDFLRGVAILLALGWHFNSGSTGMAALDLLLIPGRVIGWAGVDLFFVLSGYLVGGLMFAELAATGAFSFWRFLVRRIFKIWPVLYLYVGLLLVTGRYPAMDIVPQTLFHVQNYFLTPMIHLWSLAVEEQFYLTFALLASLAAARWERVRTWVPVALLLVMAGCVTARVIAFSLGAPSSALGMQTQFRIDGLACGVLLAWARTFRRPQYDSLAAKKWIWGPAVVLGTCAVIVSQNMPSIRWTLCYVATYLTGASLLLLLESPSTVVSRRWIFRGMAWIGTYSYAMYVFQFVLFRAGEALWLKLLKMPIPEPAGLAMRYGGAILCAVIVTKFLERPMLVLRDKLFPSKAPAP